MNNPSTEGPQTRVIAIDGPSASGKSSTAQAVAGRLGFVHLNSGLLYRAITWVALRDGWIESIDFDQGLGDLRLTLEPSPPDFCLRVNGERPGPWLKSAEVTARVSAVAARGVVRKLVNATMREAGAAVSLVVDGRDIGTAVFPDAFLKIYLTASPEERARRRLAEHGHPLSPDHLTAEAARLQVRDQQDSGRDLAPLVQADDAIEIDTTTLQPPEVVEEILRQFQKGITDPQ